MKTVWTKGLDKEQKLDIRKDYISSQLVRRRLATLCLDKIKTSDTTARNKEGYDCPNWGLKQADDIGYKRALHEILSLIE